MRCCGNVGQINISLTQWPHFAGTPLTAATLHTQYTHPMNDLRDILLVSLTPTPRVRMYSVSVSAACYEQNIQTRGRGQSLTSGHR